MTETVRRTVCSEPGCPSWSTVRGRCDAHQIRDAYDGDWRTRSREAREGAHCSVCGTTENLHADHLLPGVKDSPLDIKCASCHAKYGARRDRASKELPVDRKSVV